MMNQRPAGGDGVRRRSAGQPGGVGGEGVRAAQEVGDQLYSLVEDQGHSQLLLNFSNVQYLSSAALGKLIQLKKKVGAVKGNLKLCCIHPDLHSCVRCLLHSAAFLSVMNHTRFLAAFHHQPVNTPYPPSMTPLTLFLLSCTCACICVGTCVGTVAPGER
jgi:anti-anti-sigma factor